MVRTTVGNTKFALWEMQDKIYHTKEPPVQDLEYTLIDDELLRLIFLNMYQSNGEAAAKDVFVQVTIDNAALEGNLTLADSTNYYIHKNCLSDDGSDPDDELALSTTLMNTGGYITLEGHCILITFTMTSPPGTNQLLWVGLNYAKLKTINLVMEEGVTAC